MIETRQRQIKLVHELMYQIKVREAMTTDVVCFPSSVTFREIQRLLKERRFSGTPIVDDNCLVGIVSIDDIISAFDGNYIDAPVAEHMTRDVVSVPRDYSVIAAANMFQRYRFGRLPVVDHPGGRHLVGILTYGDILSRLVLVINSIAERFESKAVQDVERHIEPKNMRFQIAPDNFDRAGTASTAIKKRLTEMGIAPPTIRRIAVICYEAEMNMVIHSLGGFLEVSVSPDAVHITAVDEGPGITDIPKAMTAGFTTASEKIRALGFGAGMGLTNIKRCSDRFDIRSSLQTGTELEATVRLPPAEETSPDTSKGGTPA